MRKNVEAQTRVAVHQVAAAVDAARAEETVLLLHADSRAPQAAEEKAKAALHLLLHVHGAVAKNFNAG